MGQAVQYNSNNANVKRVYFSGTDTLQEGYALCYDQDASPTATNPFERLGFIVEKPATANLAAFAGLVSAGDAGKTGPCYLDIIVPTPGEVVTAYTKANATAWTTALAPANAVYSLAAHSDSGLNLPWVMLAAETADTSTTAANKKAAFKK